MWRKRWGSREREVGTERHPTERETDRCKLIQCINESSLYLATIILLFSPLTALFFRCIPPSAKLLKLQDVWKENFSCIAFLSLPPTHLHVIKASEITVFFGGEGVETVLIV